MTARTAPHRHQNGHETSTRKLGVCVEQRRRTNVQPLQRNLLPICKETISSCIHFHAGGSGRSCKQSSDAPEASKGRAGMYVGGTASVEAQMSNG